MYVKQYLNKKGVIISWHTLSDNIMTFFNSLMSRGANFKPRLLWQRLPINFLCCNFIYCNHFWYIAILLSCCIRGKTQSTTSIPRACALGHRSWATRRQWLWRLLNFGPRIRPPWCFVSIVHVTAVRAGRWARMHASWLHKKGSLE